MKRIFPIILIICLIFGVSSVYADVTYYTPQDLVYTINQRSIPVSSSSDTNHLEAVYIDSYSELETICAEYGIPLYWNNDTDCVLYTFSINPADNSWSARYGYPSLVTRWNVYLNSYARYSNSYVFPVSNGHGYWAHSSSTGAKFETGAGTGVSTIYGSPLYITARCTVPSDILYTNLSFQFAPIETINGGLVSLQSGNALVIDTLGGNITQIGLFTTLPVKSSVFSAFRSGASYFATNDLNSIKSVDFNAHAFTWDKQEGTTGILGQTDKGVYTINNPSGGRYLVIVNPRYMPRGSDHFLTNNPITVAISGTYRNLFRFSLTQSNATLVTLSDDGESLIETEEGGTNSFGGSVTFDDIPTTNPLPSSTPIVDWGTGNTPDYSDVPTLDNSVIGTATENLQGIRTEFNGFFATIRDCISWLPPQIVALLVGAMSLMVGIGIVKALL